MPSLFDPISLRGLTFKNRLFVSPMAQYSAVDGVPTDWHLVHLGSRAVGGAGMVCVEATAVSPEGRISPEDTGLWNDAQAEAFSRITGFLKGQGAHPGIQLAHAGRKASTRAPWKGHGFIPPGQGGWQPLAPSAIAFQEGYGIPVALDPGGIEKVVRDFVEASRRAAQAGFEVIELHFAHGYLAHEFLSPLSNRRADEYGGTVENRMRMPLRIAAAVRDAWAGRPLFVRLSATDWVEGGWDLPQTLELAARLKELGVDLIDCSSGGLSPAQEIPLRPGYQVPFAEAIRREVGVATGAVGLLTGAEEADEVIARGQADVVLLARELLRDPYFPLHAAKELGVDVDWPPQYLRAKG